jgi:hypothetical protein
MKKCKNTECINNIPENRVYCSYTCRNIYVNKNIRNYDKISKTLSSKTKDEYDKNPKICQNDVCCKIIPYHKRRNDYCDSSCQAKQTNKGRVYSNETKGKLRKKFYEVLKSKVTENEFNKIVYKTCKLCGVKTVKTKRRLYCSDECRKNSKRVNVTEYNQYKQDTKFNFNLSDFPYEFEFSLIEEYGWYKPVNRGNNLGGVSRDHIYSVNEGFKNKVDPKIISHPANCRLMVHSENISKNKKSDITIEELLIKIDNWNKKYLVD